MIHDILHLLGDSPTNIDGETVIYECDRCGTTVDGPNATCPYCDNSRIVTFEF